MQLSGRVLAQQEFILQNPLQKSQRPLPPSQKPLRVPPWRSLPDLDKAVGTRYWYSEVPLRMVLTICKFDLLFANKTSQNLLCM